MSNIDWRILKSIDQLREVDQLSRDHYVLIYKHSTRCAVSSASLSRLERKWDSGQQLIPYFLDLIAFRDVSDAVSERYGINHESPQVLVIRKGECVYHASHFGISFDEILENVAQIPSQE